MMVQKFPKMEGLDFYIFYYMYYIIWQQIIACTFCFRFTNKLLESIVHGETVIFQAPPVNRLKYFISLEMDVQSV